MMSIVFWLVKNSLEHGSDFATNDGAIRLFDDLLLELLLYNASVLRETLVV